MKKLLLPLFAFAALTSNAQTVFWNEDFGSGCNQGTMANTYTGSNGAWTTGATGTNDAQANQWFISATEAGMPTGSCGDGCASNPALTNATLHIGANDGFTTPDNGASYNTGGLCSFGLCVVTNTRAESPVIDCSGKIGITILFNYIENGDGANDDGSVWYYDGTTWSQLSNTTKTPATCAPQGTWTAFTATLPASADNNPNVKIGFNWTNNDDGAGSDPSFAVDSIQLAAMVITGIEDHAANYNMTILYDNDNIIINSQHTVKLASVKDLMGREVSASLEGNVLSVNAAHGAYLAELNVNGQRIFKKIIAGNN